MARLIVSEFVTLDGVMQDPGGAEKFEHGGWAFKFERGQEGDQFKVDETLNAGSLLLGRRTYEGFAAAWPGREDPIGFAAKMNSMPKYVVSSTLTEPAWTNSKVISLGDVAGLKAAEGDHVLVAGSGRLVQSLLNAGLVDELRLMVFPLVIGSGQKLFEDGTSVAALRLVEAKPVGDAGVVTLIYEPAP